jgi:hypothetical protein
MSIYADVIECERLFDELCVDHQTGEIDMEQEKSLDELRNQIINEGIEKLCKVRANKMVEIEGLKQEEERIAAKRKSLEKGLKSLEEYMKLIYDQAGQDKLQAGTFTVSMRKSIKTIVDNEELLPPHYKIQKVEYKPDLKAIKEDIQNGVEVAGCHLEEKQNIQVK